ncbi:MAG: hypothetical protein OHK0028_19140 [Deltaproteobacteria bacterium]
MMRKAEVKDLILDLCREQALVIGGLVAVHRVDDDVVWRLMKNLDLIRRRFLRRLEDTNPDDGGDTPPRRPNLAPHPAIEDYLAMLGRE